MRIYPNTIKLIIIFSVGFFLPWGRNALSIGIYPPLYFVASVFCLSFFLPFSGIRIPRIFKWFILCILCHIILTAVILGKDYLLSVRVETQFASGEQFFVRQAIVLTSICQAVFLIFFFTVMVSVIKQRKEWMMFAFSFLFGLTSVCILKLRAYDIDGWRFTGGYNDPNTFGIAACIGFFLSLMLKELFMNRMAKIASALFSVFFIIMLLFSQSRGAFLTLLIGLCVILKGKISFVHKILIIIVGILLFFILKPFFPERFSTLNSWVDDRGSMRLDIWKIYLSYFWDFFLIGVGYMRSADIISTGILKKEFVTHNVFLQILVEFGIFIFILFGLALKELWKFLKHIPQSLSWAPIAKAVFLSWIIGACFLSSFAERETWLVFSLMSSIVVLVDNPK